MVKKLILKIKNVEKAFFIFCFLGKITDNSYDIRTSKIYYFLKVIKFLTNEYIDRENKY